MDMSGEYAGSFLMGLIKSQEESDKFEYRDLTDGLTVVPSTSSLGSEFLVVLPGSSGFVSFCRSFRS